MKEETIEKKLKLFIHGKETYISDGIGLWKHNGKDIEKVEFKPIIDTIKEGEQDDG